MDMETEWLKERIMQELIINESSKWARGSHEIRTTAELADLRSIKQYNAGAIVSPVIWTALFHSALIGLMVAWIIDTTTTDKHIPPFILVWPAISIITFFIYRNIKALNQTIIIDTKGITINNKRFEWENISKTLTIKHDAPGPAYYLVIADNSGRLFRFTLNAIRLKEISSLIEYFKAKQNFTGSI